MAFKNANEEPIGLDDSPEMEEFGSALDALGGLTDGSFGEEDTPPEEAEAEVTAAEEDSEINELLADDDFDEVEEPEVSDDASMPSEVAEIEVKAGKGLHKFKLDPNNEDLIKALQLGVGARPAFSKAAKLSKENQELRSKLEGTSSLSDKARMVDDFQGLVEKGYYEQAVKAMLGDNFDQFKRSSIIAHVDYENASPEERFEMEKANMQRDREWSEFNQSKELERRTSELEAMRAEALEEKWVGIGTKLAAKYNMDAYVDDPVLAEEYNEEMWDGAWNSMKALHPNPKDWTPVELEKAFRKKARLFRGGLERQVESRLVKATEAKKAKAKDQAGLASRQNYTSNSADVSGKLKGKSALERLGILGSR